MRAIKLPTGWNEVNLKKYMEIVEVSAVDMDEIDKHIKIVSILSGEPESLILSMDLPALKEAIRSVSFIYSKPELKGVKSVIRFGLNRYEINKDLKKITGGEYIDLTALTKDKALTTANLPQILAIFFHPINISGKRIKKHYQDGAQTIESRVKTSKLIEKHLMMDDVMKMSAFFLSNWEALTRATLNYTEKQNRKIAKKLNKAIAKDLRSTGHGI